MAVDPLTRSALSILSRLASTSKDPRARRAIAHLCIELDIPRTPVATRSYPCEIRTAPAEPVTVMAPNSLTPSARELGVFFRGVLAAQRHGIVLQPDDVQFEWFDAENGDEALGTAWLNHDGVVEITLQRGMSDFELFRTVIHELGHARDALALGRPAYYAYPNEERERWAQAIEARVLLAEGFLI